MAVITGSEDSEILFGTGFADYIDARGGDDSLIGGAGGDTLAGGLGNDSLDGGSGADLLTGGAGADQFFFRAIESVVDRVTDFAARVDKVVLDNNFMPDVGSFGAFVVGDARFAAGPGFTSGRDASDRVVYDTNTGNLYYDPDGSGAGASRLVATLQGAPALAATDVVVVGQGGVAIQGSSGNDWLIGTRYDDTIDGGLGVDTMDGGLGNDRYVVTAGDVIVDSGGIDTVLSPISWALGASSGMENLLGTGSAAIALQGNNGNNRIEGNGAANVINGRAGNDTLIGNGGNDTFDISASGTSSYGNDVIDGGTGYDTIDFLGSLAVAPVVVNLSAGTASGGGTLKISGIERVYGGRFGDNITGSSGGNELYGGDGNDTIAGGGGVDTLVGGNGSDSFLFAQAAGAAHADRVVGFSSLDQLLFENGVLTGLGATGTWAAGDGRFYSASGATSAHDSSDRLVYNTSTGALYYDADGIGGASAQIVATLQGAPALTAGDITII